MFDFMNEFLSCVSQRPRCERELKEDTINGYHIDTCAIDDRDWIYETAIQHKQFNNGEWIIVRGYDTEEEARAGHVMWVEKAKAGFQKLYDVFSEKIYPKDRKQEQKPKPIYTISEWRCERCETIVRHESYMTEEELQKERVCPFCRGALWLLEFQIGPRGWGR